MAKKINLTVPDDLYEKMQKWKNDFNYSGIFQEAVIAEIRLKEDFRQRLKEDEEMEQIVKRLKGEKKESETNCYLHGREHGLMWAKASHYTDLQKAIRWETDHEDRLADPIFKKQFNTMISTFNPLYNRDAWLTNKFDKFNYEFMRGWRESVQEFWENIKDKL